MHNEGQGSAGHHQRCHLAAPFLQHHFLDDAGGDFSGTASASQSVGAIGQYTWSSAQMVADVQSWLDTPASNFGWLVLGDESTSTDGEAVRHSREHQPACADYPIHDVNPHTYAHSLLRHLRRHLLRPQPYTFFASVVFPPVTTEANVSVGIDRGVRARYWMGHAPTCGPTAGHTPA